MAGACARLKGRRANSSACSGQLEEKELVPFICLFVTSHPSFVTQKKGFEVAYDTWLSVGEENKEEKQAEVESAVNHTP